MVMLNRDTKCEGKRLGEGESLDDTPLTQKPLHVTGARR